MAWNFKWEKHANSGFYNKLLAEGRLSEEDVQPELGPFIFYWEAFTVLSSCRQSGMAIGPIPFTAVVEYSRIFMVEDFEDFLYLIRVMDQKYLELVERNLPKPKDSKKGK